jgi:glycosyltransferase involved in cell wall biosynthesis
MLKISAIVLTQDEESNIARCLENLKFCAEIIVVDSGSSDKTIEIARKFTDKIFSHKLEGFGAQRNWGVEQASNDWILFIDADEVVSTELERAIKAIKVEDIIKGYYLNRKTQYLGRWIKHSGWYPDYHLRLFHKDFGRCNEAKVHEGVIVEGANAYLKGDLLHFSYKSLSQHLKKIDRYTTRIALERYQQGRQFHIIKMVFCPLGEFLKKYILKLGFFDGVAGFAIALSSAYYVFLKQAKLYEIKMKNDQ